MAAGWKTGEQQVILDIGPDGKATEAVAVDYENDAGTIHGRITVPLGEHADTTFDKMFAARVKLHDHIASA